MAEARHAACSLASAATQSGTWSWHSRGDSSISLGSKWGWGREVWERR